LIALETSSAAGKDPVGGIPGAIRNLVHALLRIDPETPYRLCSRVSRWKRGDLFRPDAPNVSIGLLQDPFNRLLLRRARLLHCMGIFCPRTPRVPKLVTVHDLNAVRNVQWVTPRWHERRSRKIREAVERADHVVTYSRFTADEVQEEYGLPRERVHAAHLGVDPDLFRPPSGETVQRVRAQRGDFVLSIGLLTPRKNFPGLVEAVARLPRSVRLVLVGRPSDGAEAVRKAVERHGMEERFDHLERVSADELVALLGACRVYTVPSLYEGFGLTVLEGMGCGAPVVCSNSASLPEAAGDAALLVDASDGEGLTEALRRVLEDTAFANDLRARGLERAHTWTWERSARRLRRLYHDVSGV
jgi:alpha-1,3-rhamnosyl/mannosyltransferase